MPTVSPEVVNVATPLPFKDIGVPRLVPLSLNCTVPVGVPVPDVTVAVNVTAWPKSDGLTEVLTVVTVIASTVAVLLAVAKFPLSSAIWTSTS